jgi:hypothetical protein
MMNKCRFISILLSILLIPACNSDLPSDGGDDFTPIGYAEPLSESEFEELSAEQQYQVASKLLGTMYKGLPVEDFLSISSSLRDPDLRVSNDNADFLQDVRDSLNTDLSYGEVVSIEQSLSKYDFSNDERPKEEPLALIYEYPLSRQSFIAWMAHFLGNTIMFSPAEEMESTDIYDVQNTYKRLVTGLTDGNSVRQLIRSHLPSLQRWRVARTPENTGIEGFELYLGLFEMKADSARVGKACKDFYLTGEDEDYLLVSTNSVNTDPQIILKEDTDDDGVGDSGGYFITTCDDFYNVLSGHPLIMPRACAVIVNYLMAERSASSRLEMCESIVSSGAVTFEDLFKGVIFSREYLLDTERPKGFEEALMPALHALKWDSRLSPGSSAGDSIWENMGSNEFNRLFMGNMGWNTMTLKIGRTPEVPVDALSFANYHKAIRESLLMNDATYRGGSNSRAGLFYNGNGSARSRISDLSPRNFIHFLFLTALQRPATSTEISALMPLITPHLQTVGGDQVVINGRHDDIGRIVFDYASRLAEFYYFKNI